MTYVTGSGDVVTLLSQGCSGTSAGGAARVSPGRQAWEREVKNASPVGATLATMFPVPQMLFALAIAAYVAAPVLFITGWIRWARHPQPRDIVPVLALAGFVVGSASALLALGGVLYGLAIGGFPYYDPRLLRIYGAGLLLSLAGLIVGLLGLARPSPLRWHAPVLSLAMLVLWLLWMQGE